MPDPTSSAALSSILHTAGSGLRWPASALALLACAIVLLGCNAPADHPALRDASLPPLLQAHRFAYRGDVPSSYQLAPDGSKLAWIGPYFMRSRLFVRDNATGEVKRYRIGASGFQWTPDGRRLLYTSDKSGAENTHVYMIDLEADSRQPVDLTPHAGVKARIHQMVPGSSNQLLVLHNRRDARLLDLYRIDLDTGKEILVAQNPGDGITAAIAPDGRVGWQRSAAAQRAPEVRQQPLARRKPALLAAPGEIFRVLGRDQRGFVWALSSRGRDRVALVLVHPTLGWERVIFEDPQVDVSNVTMSRVTGRPLLAQAEPGYPRVAILDAALQRDLASVLKEYAGAPFGLEIVSTDDNEERLVVLVYTASHQRYYLVDRKAGSHTLLGESIDRDFADALAPMEPVAIESRDGLKLHGYLTVPRGVTPKALPMVLLVHGGPWLRTSWGNPLRSDDASYAQFLANRGYAVLQVNFRGSTGYGQRFLTAAVGEFAGRMQDDLHDAVAWAIERGIADPARVAIMGWSYGGYAALVGMTMTPAAFACGVSLAGPTDLPSLVESFPPYWKVDLAAWHDYVGNPAVSEDRAEMIARSPLHHAHDAKRPVLLIHGTNDVRVRADQSRRMAEALRQAGVPVEHLEIEEMGHGMGYWVHRLALLRKTETFLRDCLGGRASRFDPFDAIAWVWTRISR